MRHGDGAATTVPDWTTSCGRYGSFGFSAEHTAILGYAWPYVLFATPRRDDPYSIIDTRNGRTVERWPEPAVATARLGELAPDRAGR